MKQFLFFAITFCNPQGGGKNYLTMKVIFVGNRKNDIVIYFMSWKVKYFN